MRSDAEIEKDVRAELKWSPALEADDIAVAVKDGVVTLAGFVHTYADKFDAERAAKRVAGVLGVANDIEVRLRSIDARPDPEITRDAVTAIKSQLPISYEKIKVVTHNGWISLEGDVEWQYQKQTAESAIRFIPGLKGATNLIQIRPRIEPSEVKRKIEEALARSAEIDASQIKVNADGNLVVLKGKVRSWIEREEAERAAWSAPGVVKVENHIDVRP